MLSVDDVNKLEEENSKLKIALETIDAIAQALGDNLPLIDWNQHYVEQIKDTVREVLK